MTDPADPNRVTDHRPNRRLSPLLAAGGVVLSLTIGAALAAVIDTVDLNDNVGSTGEVTPAGGDIQLAVLSDVVNQSCESPGLSYEDGPFEGVFVQQFDLESGFNVTTPRSQTDQPQPRAGGEAFGQSVALCIRNAGSAPALVRHSSSVDFNTENGGCTDSEVAAGDTTCGPRSLGEIDDLGFYAITPDVGPCTSVGTPLDGGGVGQEWGVEDDVVLFESIEPGASCSVLIAPFVQAPDDDAYLRMQTDQIGWSAQIYVES